MRAPHVCILQTSFAKREDTVAFLKESIRELDKMGYDAIIMAQVSMRTLLTELKDVKTPLLCSFFPGYGAIADKLNEIAAQQG